MSQETTTAEAAYDPEEAERTRELIAECSKAAAWPPRLTVSEWADRYRRLSTENSAEAGRWRTSRTPYLRRIMDSYTDPGVSKIVVVASSQVGKTEMLLNMLAYDIDIDPGPIMWATPTNDNAEDFSKRRLEPMVRDTPRLRRKLDRGRGGNRRNTTLKKRFPGGMLTMVGSNSPANLASVPARYVFGDEIDRWAKDAGGEGDPGSLLEARTATFYNSKIVEVSTPTVRGASAIAREYALGTRERWCAQCPHCGKWGFVRFGDIRFDHERHEDGGQVSWTVSDVEWCCPSCGCLTAERDVRRAPHKWVADNPGGGNGTRSFWINGFSSPWMSWEHICVRFLEAKDDPAKLRAVYNTLFGELWEERGEVADTDELAERGEDWGAELPDGALCLTCGVDTQDNRLEYEVVGHGLFGETWGIQRGVLWGRPDAPDTESSPNVWSQLDAVIGRSWGYADGKRLRVSLTFVDSGGHYTQDVYRECAARQGRNVYPIKGRGGPDVPYVNPPKRQAFQVRDASGRTRTASAWLYTIGVDSGKEKVMSSLQVQQAGPRYCHFAGKERGYDHAYYDGLVSEHQVLSPTGRWQWKKIAGRARNEPLDCRNYAMAAFEALNPDMERLQRARTAPKAAKRRGRGRVVSRGIEI